MRKKKYFCSRVSFIQSLQHWFNIVVCSWHMHVEYGFHVYAHL